MIENSAPTTSGKKVSKRLATTDSNTNPKKKQVVQKENEGAMEISGTSENADSLKDPLAGTNLSTSIEPKVIRMKLRSRNLPAQTISTQPKDISVDGEISAFNNTGHQIQIQDIKQAPAVNPQQQDIPVGPSPRKDPHLSRPRSFRACPSSGPVMPVNRVDILSRDAHSRRTSKIHNTKSISNWQLKAHDPSVSSAKELNRTELPQSAGLSSVEINSFEKKTKKLRKRPPKQQSVALNGQERHANTKGQRIQVQKAVGVHDESQGGGKSMIRGCWCWWPFVLLLLLLLLIGLWRSINEADGSGVCYLNSEEYLPMDEASEKHCRRFTKCPLHGRCWNGRLTTCLSPFRPTDDYSTCKLPQDFIQKVQPHIDYLREKTTESICLNVFKMGPMPKVNYSLTELEEATGVRLANGSIWLKEMSESFEVAGKQNFALSWTEVSSLNLPFFCSIPFFVRNNLLVLSLAILLAEVVVWVSFY